MISLKLYRISYCPTYWYTDDDRFYVPVFCRAGFNSLFDVADGCRICTLEVRLVNPRKKGWIKLTVRRGSWTNTVRANRERSKGVGWSLLSRAVRLVEAAGIPPSSTRPVWARVTYRRRLGVSSPGSP